MSNEIPKSCGNPSSLIQAIDNKSDPAPEVRGDLHGILHHFGYGVESVDVLNKATGMLKHSVYHARKLMSSVRREIEEQTT